MDPDTHYLQWDRNKRRPSPAPPPRSGNSQFHIYGDAAKYSPKRGALYDPPDARFQDILRVLDRMGFERGVIVHSSDAPGFGVAIDESRLLR